MSSSLFESIARIARHESAKRPVAAIGRVVDTYGPSDNLGDYAVSVELRDSGLVLPRVPVASGVLGFAAIPAVEDLVIVVFAEGSYHAPVVVGRLYTPDLNAPKHDAGQLTLQLPPGDDEPALDLTIDGNEPSWRLKMPGDVLLECVEEKINLTVGELKLVIDAGGGGSAELAAGGAVLRIKQDGDITLSTQGNLTLEGNEVSISGMSKVSVSAPQVEIN